MWIAIENLRTFKWEWWLEQGPSWFYPSKNRSEFPRSVRVHSLEISCGEEARKYAIDLYNLPYLIDVRIKP